MSAHSSSRSRWRNIGLVIGLACSVTAMPAAQSATTPTGSAVQSKPPVIPPGITPPADYVIGPDDVLAVVFWRDADMSSEVTVRPDGKISLVLINEIQAGGLTPEELRVAVTTAASKFVADPTVTIVVRQIKSRKVFITGQVSKPGPYLILAPTTVVQLIAEAGGVLEWADAKNIMVMRTQNGKATSTKVNYRDLERGKSLHQNIPLRPGDTVIVP